MSPNRSLARRVTRNWQAKLAAFVLATQLWIFVRAEQTTEQSLRVPVEAQILDPDYRLASAPRPAVVEVRFSGKWRELGELALNKPVVVVPVRTVNGQRSFVLEPSLVHFPNGFRGGVQAMDVRPRVVTLDLQPVIRRAPRRAVGAPVRGEARDSVAPDTLPNRTPDTTLAPLPLELPAR